MFEKKDNLVLLLLVMILTFPDSRGMSFSRWTKCYIYIFERKKWKGFPAVQRRISPSPSAVLRDLLLCLKFLPCQHNGGKSHSGSKHQSSTCSCLALEPGAEHHTNESILQRLFFTSWGQESAGDKIPLKVPFTLT